MTDMPDPSAPSTRVHGDADALAAVTVRRLPEPKPLNPAEAEALLGSVAALAPATDTAKPAVQSTTILAAITAAAPAVVLLADDIGRVVHGPALANGDQALAVGAIVTVVGAVAAIWGRCRASTAISGVLQVRK